MQGLEYRSLHTASYLAACRTSSAKGSAGRPSADEDEAGPKQSARVFLMKTAKERLSEAFQGACPAV